MKYRYAKKEDISLIIKFIKDLAEYEKLSNEVVTDEKTLSYWLFDCPKAEVIFALNELNEEVGFALFFYNFSTFQGKAGLYLEDLYVRPQYRELGYGKFLLSTLAKIAVSNNCGRFEWMCLDWNKSSIDFYLSLGASPIDGWTKYRLSDESLDNLANIN